MSKVFLINIGANTSDESKLKSSYCLDAKTCKIAPFIVAGKSKAKSVDFPESLLENLNKKIASSDLKVHLDPDWNNFTYGDNCRNGRAAALREVQVNDILLFWGLLWDRKNDQWTGGKRWCLFGSLKIEEIVFSDKVASEKNYQRVFKNLHFEKNENLSEADAKEERIFVGHQNKSKLYKHPVPFYLPNQLNTLFYETIKTADGNLISRDKKSWSSPIRACRTMWNLDIEEDRIKAEKVRDEIKRHNVNFDLLSN